MWWFRAGAAGALLVLLAGCGFEPLYGPSGRQGPAVTAALAGIYVASIRDRIGQRLRNDLLDRLTPQGIPSAPVYNLEVTLREDREGLAIRKDETVTRFNLTLRARFVLIDRRTGGPIFRGATQSIAAYNVVESSFATLIAEQDAEARAAREISEEVRNQISIFFKRQQK